MMHFLALGGGGGGGGGRREVVISGLFKHAITVGKEVRAEANTAAGKVSVSSAGVELALMKLLESSHATARMLVMGAGKNGGTRDQTLGSKRVHKDDRCESK